MGKIAESKEILSEIQENDKKSFSIDLDVFDNKQNQNNKNTNKNSILSENENSKNNLSDNLFIEENVQVSEKKSIFEKFNKHDQEYYYKSFVMEEKNLKTNKKKGVIFCFNKIKFKFKSMAFYLNNNYYFLILITCLTFYVLFIDYFRIMIFNKGADIVFDILVIICMFIFTLELLVLLISQKDYFFSYYFIIDLTTIALLVFDITLVSNNTFYSNKDVGVTTGIILELSKIFRLIRIIRIFKLIKTLELQKTKKKKINNSSNLKKESKITTRLKELNIKRMVILILIMLCSMPFFELELWFSKHELKIENKLKFSLPALLINPANNDNFLKKLKSGFQEADLELLYINVEGVYLYESSGIEKIRINEISSMKENIVYKNNEYSVTMMFSHRYQTIIEALLDLVNTIFICLILLISINNLNKNFSELILNPLERMIEKIKKVSENPLSGLKTNYTNENKMKGMNETLIIEKAINKISELLILGFGQAGCTVISQFLFDPDKDFDQIIPGRKVCAIFGFCDIRNFTDATEVLLEDIMVFVNEIANIVHNSVDNFGGAANKNIGDAFLLVWKLEIPANFEDSNNNREIEIFKKDLFNRQLAELSLISFIDIIIQINTSKVITNYRNNKKLCDRMPGYSVKMGFGLHVGWAIEGAIGSRFKIDASYLSPNVNMAARLEAATKQFDKMILFTGDLYDMFITDRLKLCSRHIDTVMVKGSHHPMRLYTVDLNTDKLIIKNKKRLSVPMDRKKTFKNKTKLTNNFKSLEIGIIPMDNELIKIRTCQEEELIEDQIKQSNFYLIFDFNNETLNNFKTVYAFALDYYLEGKWDLAKKFFEKALSLIPNDGPTLVLLDYLKTENFIAPNNWNNCRQLLEK
jgi:class 3 adenylate cyclase